jgi:hypothetical protein
MPQTFVEWYSGHTLYDRPRRLFWSGQWIEVVAILERGYTPDGAFFKIIASNQGIFLLKYCLYADAWRSIRLR